MSNTAISTSTTTTETRGAAVAVWEGDRSPPDLKCMTTIALGGSGAHMAIDQGRADAVDAVTKLTGVAPVLYCGGGAGPWAWRLERDGKAPITVGASTTHAGLAKLAELVAAESKDGAQ